MADLCLDETAQQLLIRSTEIILVIHLHTVLTQHLNSFRERQHEAGKYIQNDTHVQARNDNDDESPTGAIGRHWWAVSFALSSVVTVSMRTNLFRFRKKHGFGSVSVFSNFLHTQLAQFQV